MAIFKQNSHFETVIVKGPEKHMFINLIHYKTLRWLQSHLGQEIILQFSIVLKNKSFTGHWPRKAVARHHSAGRLLTARRDITQTANDPGLTALWESRHRRQFSPTAQWGLPLLPGSALHNHMRYSPTKAESCPWGLLKCFSFAFQEVLIQSEGTW